MKMAVTTKLRIYLTLYIIIICCSILAFVNKNLLINTVLTHYAQKNFGWQTTTIKDTLLTKSGSVHWLQLDTQGKFPYATSLKGKQNTQLLKINLIDANLADKNIYLSPVLAKTIDPQAPYLQSLQVMGKENPALIAGINGGYFFLNKSKHHRDENCLSKSYPEFTTQGIGDGLLIINNSAYATNCSSGIFPEKARSSIIENQNQQWEIKKTATNKIPSGVINALGAGPGLITNMNGKPVISVDWENILSTFEFAANTAVILATDKNHHCHVIFFTVDGEDKVAGMSAIEMANFIATVLPDLLHLKIISAMSMDQGHSTTMYVKQANPQIVSRASPNRSPRLIYDGLFIATKTT